jgi:DNA polymerase-3 subunit epsilon
MTDCSIGPQQGTLSVEALEAYAGLLEGSGLYRVLKRLTRREVTGRSVTNGERVAVFVDTETTGLDPDRDEVIELGMIAVAYDLDGRLNDILGTFGGFREPSVSISAIASEITGITWEMVVGQQIASPEVDRFVERASLIVAHNAAFDRPMCEKHFAIFSSKPWACSAVEIPWQQYGFEGTKLAYLVNQSGWFYDAHRAVDDCAALLELLAKPLPNSRLTGFQQLLEAARMPRLRFWAITPYEQRGLLRARGYRWNPGGNGRPRAWWREVFEPEETAEAAFLKDSIGLPASKVTVERVTAFDRYRSFNRLSRSARKNDSVRIPHRGSDNCDQ